MQRLRRLLLGKGDLGYLQVGIRMCGIDSQNMNECASSLGILSPGDVMVAEVAPQARRMGSQLQRALVEWLCLLIFLLRIQYKTQQAKQVRPVWLEAKSCAQTLLGLLQLPLLECGGGLGVSV